MEALMADDVGLLTVTLVAAEVAEQVGLLLTTTE
jgi:hypothetical protein